MVTFLSLFPSVDVLEVFALFKRNRESRRISRRQETEIRKMRKALLVAMSFEQPDLFGITIPCDVDSDVKPSKVFGSRKDFYQEVAEKWTDEQIVRLCDAMVETAMTSLRDSTRAVSRRETFEWLAPISDPNVIFTFAFCCRIAGLNHEELSRQIYRIYGEEIRSFIEGDNLREEAGMMERS